MSEVNLVSISKPSSYTGCSTAEELIAWAARVSNPANQGNHTSGPKLVRSLLRDKHWSPLEMVTISMEIKTTRDIARQILRHRSFSFQEFSQRYADPTKTLGFELREARLQDWKNRQNSIELSPSDKLLQENWNMIQKELVDKSIEAYKWAVDNNIAKEQARAVLPEGCTESSMIMMGTLRSWVHYCDLRRKWDTQKEHRIVAQQCWEIIKQHFPNVVEACESLGD